LAELKLLDGAGWNVGSGSADRFVADINSVDVDAGGPAETAAE
jgi:hypothetical protein